MKKVGFNYGAGKMTAILVSTVLLFFSRYFPLPGLGVSGSMVIWILVGAMILWLSIDVTWTSLYVIFALMTVPDLGVSYALQNSFANSTAVLIVFCFMLSAGIVQSGFARRIAILLITNKFSRKGPWNSVLMIITACFVLGLFLPSSTSILISLPICDAILTEIGMKKYENMKGIDAVIVVGANVGGALGNAATPISHAVTIQGMGYFTQYTGGEIDFFTFCAVLIPVGIVCILAYWLLCRYLWKPDASKLHDINFDEMKASCGPMDQREKWSAYIYLFVVVLWILPGVFKYISPKGLYPILSKVDSLYPPLIGVFLMQIIKLKDGKPIRPYKDSLGYVSWGTYIFLASIMCVGAAFGNKDLGIAEWLNVMLTPVFSGVAPWLFILIMVAFGAIMTNFTSNAVMVAVMMALAMPLCQGLYAGLINPVVLALLCITSVQHAYATAPGAPPSAIVADSGWITTGTMFKFGIVQVLVDIVLIYGVGSGLAALFV